MSEKCKLRAGVIGLGVGEQHAHAYAQHPDVRLMRLVDQDDEKRKQIQLNYPSIELCDEADAVLAAEDIDVVSIASFDDQHFEHIMRALDHGKHVFVEKPLCQTSDELNAIQRQLKDKPHLHLGCNLILRAAPLFVWLKAYISSGEMGEIYAYEGSYLYGRLSKITEGWRKEVENYSVMEGGGVHLIDLILWLTGLRPNKIFTAGNHICTQDTAFRYEDYVSSTHICEGGAVGRITADFGCVQPHRHTLRISGTRRTFILDDKGPRLYKNRDPELAPEMLDLAPLAPSKGALIPRFIESILTKTIDCRTHETIFDGMRICVASDLALQHGALTDVSYE